MPIPFAAIPLSFIAWMDTDAKKQKLKKQVVQQCRLFHKNLDELKVGSRALGCELLEGSD
jgi:hypothetical protein